MKKIMKEKAGFTLIELIVVIAIMGILAGVGTVAYTGYVKRANQAVDQQSVADLIYAVQLADYSDPNLFEDGNVGMIFLTDSGTVASIGTTDYNSDSGALTTALNNAVNLEGISLQYSGWGTSTSAAQAMLKTAYDTELSTLLNGEAEVSYASSASELWDAMATLVGIFAGTGNYADYTEGELFAEIASNTANLSGLVSAWSSKQDIYGQLSGDAYAKSGVNLARNISFAKYLQQAGVDVEESDITMLSSYAWGLTNDIVTVITDTNYDGNEILKTSQETMQDALDDYLDSLGCTYTDSSGDETTCSQAYLDATAYLTMMTAVDKVSNGEDAIYDPSDSSYMEDVKNYVLYGASICSGLIDLSAVEAMLESIEGSSVIVIITAYKDDDGIQCDVLPTAADVRESGSSSTDSSNYESSDYILSFSPESVILSTGNSQTVTVSCSDLSFTDSNASTYTFASDDDAVATATKTSATTFSVTGVGSGTTNITVTVTDSNGKTATGTISVTVSTQASATMSTRIRFNAKTSAWSVSTKEASDTNYNGTATLSAGSVVSLVLEDCTASGNNVSVTASGNTVTTGTTSGNSNYTTTSHTGTVSYSVANGTYNEVSGTVTVGTSGTTVITVTVTDNADSGSTASGTFTITISE